MIKFLTEKVYSGPNGDKSTEAHSDKVCVKGFLSGNCSKNTMSQNIQIWLASENAKMESSKADSHFTGNRKFNFNLIDNRFSIYRGKITNNT